MSLCDGGDRANTGNDRYIIGADAFHSSRDQETGITVATIARNTPYQINSEERPMIS